MAIIEGTAYWASLTRPNEKFEPMWRIDLAVDSKSAEDFKGQGISVAETTVDEKTIPNIITIVGRAVDCIDTARP